MARIQTDMLDIGHPFPELEAQSTTGESLRIPDCFNDWGILLVYRGEW